MRKKGKLNFEVPDSSVVGRSAVLFYLAKPNFRRRILLTSAEFNIGRIMSFYSQNEVKFVCLQNSNNLFPDPINYFQIPHYNITINTFICCYIYFFGNSCNYCFMSCVNIDFASIFLALGSSELRVWKIIWFGSFFRSNPLISSLLRISVFHSYTLQDSCSCLSTKYVNKYFYHLLPHNCHI